MSELINIEAARSLLIKTVTDPGSVEELSENQWDLVLRMIRRARLLGRLACQVEKNGLAAKIPIKASDQLISARKVAKSRKRMALWEIDRLQRALREVDADVIVLKGCGYLIKDLQVSEGRIFSDVDIMVLRLNLDCVENTLKEKGWESTSLDDYDEYYYREWMHEIPPLRHPDRGIEVDLHHNILPLTGIIKTSPSRLFETSVRVNGYDFKVLGPFEMVIHSATHLFYGTELNGDLRDLIDLDELLRYFAETEDDFWSILEVTAVEMDLQRPLFYAARYCEKILKTPVPEGVSARYRIHGPNPVILLIMDKLISASIFPDHPEIPSRTIEIWRWLLYVRSHFLKMPIHLLIPHLFRKFIKKRIFKNSVN